MINDYAFPRMSQEDSKMTRRTLTEDEKQWCLNLRAVFARRKAEWGITQETLADKIGWKSQGTVAHYINGRNPLNTDAKVAFAKALEVPVTEIDPELIKEVVGQYVGQKSGNIIDIVLDEIAAMPEDKKITALLRLLVEITRAIEEARAEKAPK